MKQASLYSSTDHGGGKRGCHTALVQATSGRLAILAAIRRASARVGNLAACHLAFPSGAIGRLSCDMALPPKEPKAPLWLWAVGIVAGFALGAGLAYLLVR